MLSLKKAVSTVSVVFLTCFIFPSLVAADEVVVRAKIGIEIIKDGKKDSGRQAGPIKNSLSPNESLMVHVTPEIDAFVYIVNSNKKGAELLNPNNQLAKKAQTRIFPTANQSYKPDGKNEEFITVIISAGEQTKIKTLFASGSVSYEEWKQLEEDLLKKRRIPKPEGPSHGGGIDMGGSVRGLEGGTRTSIGMGWIVKRYKFNVEN